MKMVLNFFYSHKMSNSNFTIFVIKWLDWNNITITNVSTSKI